LTVLITGGSQGSRTLNRAAEESWPLFRQAGVTVRFLHQTGVQAEAEIARKFAEAGMVGEVTAFITDMPRAFEQADVVACRAGAGALAEVAAAGKASILVPYPFAADDHQLRNAEALAKAGAARLVLDRDMDGKHLFEEVQYLSAPGRAEEIAANARSFAKPGAAARAADILEECAGAAKTRNLRQTADLG
jgi:UDP-N-acetylglucosamine--N-acetylmuramyl-(pentapeptide) pyrophosphoryl-undecaprenol N-acetylglucosamine transferase